MICLRISFKLLVWSCCITHFSTLYQWTHLIMIRMVLQSWSTILSLNVPSSTICRKTQQYCPLGGWITWNFSIVGSTESPFLHFHCIQLLYIIWHYFNKLWEKTSFLFTSLIVRQAFLGLDWKPVKHWSGLISHLLKEFFSLLNENLGPTIVIPVLTSWRPRDPVLCFLKCFEVVMLPDPNSQSFNVFMFISQTKGDWLPWGNKVIFPI